MASPSHRYWATTLYDAIGVASGELMTKQQGRKALIVFSDGVDNASDMTAMESIESAQRADALVYSVLFADARAYPGTRGVRQHGIKVLQQLATETGGSYFEVSDGRALKKAFARIDEGLRSEYSLGYVSDQIGSGPGYRKIGLRTRQEGLSVHARDGYYATK